eukprot:5290493-Prymnesium_polylepis.1
MRPCAPVRGVDSRRGDTDPVPERYTGAATRVYRVAYGAQQCATYTFAQQCATRYTRIAAMLHIAVFRTGGRCTLLRSACIRF